jgi:hypothetical protein
MNKPNKIKIIENIDKNYIDDLIKIFDNNYKNHHNTLHHRPTFFKNVDCDFTVNRFNIENKIKFNSFVKISQNLLQVLENLYGPGKFWNIQIAKMQGGGIILPHIDSGLGFVFSHRIHIPLMTNEKVVFKVEDDSFYLSCGNVYEINNLKEHSVINKNQPNFFRIHLIFDYISNEYIQFILNNKINYGNNKVIFNYC